jgi:uncharacterized short protein YbdD (DUF466 family)
MRNLLGPFVARVCQCLRQMIGIPDYEVYVKHVQSAHPGQACMTYEEFFRERQLNRYEGKTPGSRCC